MNLWIKSIKLILCLSAFSPTNSADSTETSKESTTTSDVKSTDTKLDFINFTVLTLDGDNSTKENDSTKYSVQTYDYKIYEFKFNDGVKCVGLNYQDKQVWTHDKDKHKDQFPTSIFLHLQSNRVYLALKDSMFIYTHQDNKWTETEANLVQLDISKTDSTTEYQCLAKDNIGTYTPKTNVLFQEVIRKKGSLSCGSDYTFIQAKDPGQYVYKVVRDGTDLTKSITKATLYLLNGDVSKFARLDSSFNNQWVNIVSVHAISIEATDGKDDKSTSELKGVMVAMDEEKSTAEFEFSKDDKTMTYTAKEGYGFSEVKWLRSKVHAIRADRDVWKTENPSDFAQKVVVNDLGFLRYDLHIHLFDNKGFHLYHRPAWGSQWSYTYGILREPKLEPQKAENIPSTEHPKEISVVLKGQTDSKDSKNPNNSDPNYSVHKYSTESEFVFYEYEFRDDHECTEFKFEDKSVWTHDPAKANQGHPKSVFVFLNTKTVIFIFKEGVIFVSRFEGDAWKSVFENKPETCAVDINSETGDVGLDYNKESPYNNDFNILTYTAKDNHLINTVKTQELVLWTTDKLNQYATKVDIRGRDCGEKLMTIYLLNGDTRMFYKTSRNLWLES